MKVTQEKATPLTPETLEIEPAGRAAKNSPRFVVFRRWAGLKHFCRWSARQARFPAGL